MNPKPYRMAILLGISLLFHLAVEGAEASVTEVCRDTTSTFVGVLIQEGIVLTWETDGEDAALGEYRIARYNCANPDECSVAVATVVPTGSPNVLTTYSKLDTPPGPLSSWTYTIEIRRASGTRACAIDSEPQ